jgi:hypothetical protein
MSTKLTFAHHLRMHSKSDSSRESLLLSCTQSLVLA